MVPRVCVRVCQRCSGSVGHLRPVWCVVVPPPTEKSSYVFWSFSFLEQPVAHPVGVVQLLNLFTFTFSLASVVRVC